MIGPLNEMGSKSDYYERRSCKGKQNHADPINALVECVMMRRRHGASVWAYRCRFCGNYHTGHVPARVREFVQDLIEPCETILLTYTLGDSLNGTTLKKLRLRT